MQILRLLDAARTQAAADAWDGARCLRGQERAHDRALAAGRAGVRPLQRKCAAHLRESAITVSPISACTSNSPNPKDNAGALTAPQTCSHGRVAMGGPTCKCAGV